MLRGNLPQQKDAVPLPVIVHLLQHHLENVTAQCTEECQFPQLVKIYSLVSDYDGRVHEPSTSVDCLILLCQSRSRLPPFQNMSCGRE